MGEILQGGQTVGMHHHHHAMKTEYKSLTWQENQLG